MSIRFKTKLKKYVISTYSEHIITFFLLLFKIRIIMVCHNHNTENYRNLSDLWQPKKYFVYRTISKRLTRHIT